MTKNINVNDTVMCYRSFIHKGKIFHTFDKGTVIEIFHGYPILIKTLFEDGEYILLNIDDFNRFFKFYDVENVSDDFIEEEEFKI